MKLTKLFSKLWLSAAALLAFSACSNEDLPTQTTSEAPKTKKVQLQLTATQNDESLRAVFGLDNDKTSDTYGTLTGLQMSDKNVILRIGVRQGDGEALVQDIEFTKDKNRNYATYTGEITVPTGGTGAYKIAAILIGEVGGDTFFYRAKNADTPTAFSVEADLVTNYNFNFSNQKLVIPAETDNTVKLNVPYITKWQDLDVDGNYARSTTLYFEPQGTVLRMRVRNDSENAQTFRRVKFVTTSFVERGNYRINMERDNQPLWYPFNIESVIWTIPNGGVTVPGRQGATSSYSPWMYYWVMPRKLDLVKRNTTASLGLSETEQHIYYPAFGTTQSLPTGSVPMTLVYNDGHAGDFGTDLVENPEWGTVVETPQNPLNYVAEYILDNTGKAFLKTDVENVNNPNVGFFSYTEMKNLLKDPIDGVQYHVPTRNELASILVPIYDKSGVGLSKFTAGISSYDVVESNIKLGSVTQDFKADYHASTTALYGIRFKNSTNKYRTAFRYTSNRTPGYVMIEAVHIGSELVTLSDVMKNDFWDTRADQIVSRKIYYYGAKISSNVNIEYVGQVVSLGTVDLYDEGAMYGSYIEGWTKPTAQVSPISLQRSPNVLPFKN